MPPTWSKCRCEFTSQRDALGIDVERAQSRGELLAARGTGCRRAARGSRRAPRRRSGCRVCRPVSKTTAPCGMQHQPARHRHADRARLRPRGRARDLPRASRREGRRAGSTSRADGSAYGAIATPLARLARSPSHSLGPQPPPPEHIAMAIRHDFHKLNRLPPYLFAEVIALMAAARRRGEDVIDLGMGNPDLPTPTHVVDKICEAARNPRNHRYSASRGLPNLRAAISEWYQRRHAVAIDPGPRGDRGDRLEGRARPLHPDDDRPGRRRAVSRSRVSDPPVLGDHRGRRPAHRPAHARHRLHREPRDGDAAHLAEAEAADPVVPGEPDRPGRRPRLLRARDRVRARERPDGRARLRVRRRSASTATSRRASSRCRARATSRSSSARSRSRTRWRAGASASRPATPT